MPTDIEPTWEIQDATYHFWAREDEAERRPCCFGAPGEPHQVALWTWLIHGCPDDLPLFLLVRHEGDWAVTEARTGRAFAWGDDPIFALVVLILRLHGSGGWDALREVAAEYPDVTTLPVLPPRGGLPGGTPEMSPC